MCGEAKIATMISQEHLEHKAIWFWFGGIGSIITIFISLFQESIIVITLLRVSQTDCLIETKKSQLLYISKPPVLGNIWLILGTINHFNRMFAISKIPFMRRSVFL